MTIDEAIKFISERKILNCPMSCEYCANFGCIINKIIAMLEELKWYREQDLIRREEVPLMRLYMAINANHFEDAGKILNSIPKVEPPKGE